jgi:uncharacterized membrane protein
MTPMTEKQAARWAKTRQMGRGRYTLIYGVLIWGVVTGILWAVAMAWMQGWNQLPGFLIFGLIGFPIGGYFYGRLMWRIFEARYDAAKQEKAKRR